MLMTVSKALAAALCLAAAGRAAAVETAAPALVPWPQSVTVEPGWRELKPAARIVVSDAALAPLARILAEELHLTTALNPPVVTTGSAGADDIVLRLTNAVTADEGYRLTVGPAGIAVEGKTYRGAAWGTVTLLEAIAGDGQSPPRLPCVTVTDAPAAPYRGLLIDVARQWHPVSALRPLIELCRLYKINYLQLHLNDQQSTVFPSQAFPQLASATKGRRRTYTLAEITGLVQYADERGVTLVPELEGPGHHAGNLRALWGRGGTLDVFNEKTYAGLNVLLGELCDVFKSSPYIHIGGDEGSFGHLGKSPEEQAYLAAHGLKGGALDHYIRRLDALIKQHGKRTICWEGFHGDGGGLPRDIIVMPFESAYNPANKLVAHGFTVINTAWKPLYVVGNKKWSAEYIYDHWNLRLWEHHVNTRTHIQLPPGAPVLGAQMCAWEQAADVELPSLRERLHALSERIWNPDAGRTYADFAARAARTDQFLDRLLGCVTVQVQGLAGRRERGWDSFWKPITVTLSAPPIGTIHYTLDGQEPTPRSPRYAGPLTLSQANTHREKLFFNSRTKRFEADGDVVRLKARLFDAAGQPVGDVVTGAQFWHRPPEAQANP